METYEVFAIRYATRDALRSSHFIGGDPHDGPMPMDYFVWLVRNASRTFVVDTGFTADMAKKRKRTFLRTPTEGLALMGVDARTVKDVVITHMHYDHVGTFFDFPAAQFHLQDLEMNFATGRYMRHGRFSHGYEVEDVVGMVRLVFGDRVRFHAGSAELAPGLSVHHIGGHTMGLQCVRVATARGWLVLASDCSHYYEHMETGRVFPTTFHVGDTVEGYDKLRALAESPEHIIPGHDPLVMKRYPAPSKALEGIARQVGRAAGRIRERGPPARVIGRGRLRPSEDVRLAVLANAHQLSRRLRRQLDALFLAFVVGPRAAEIRVARELDQVALLQVPARSGPRRRHAGRRLAAGNRKSSQGEGRDADRRAAKQRKRHLSGNSPEAGGLKLQRLLRRNNCFRRA